MSAEITSPDCLVVLGVGRACFQEPVLTDADTTVNLGDLNDREPHLYTTGQIYNTKHAHDISHLLDPVIHDLRNIET